MSTNIMTVEIRDHHSQLPEVLPGKKISRGRNRGPWRGKVKNLQLNHKSSHAKTHNGDNEVQNCFDKVPAIIMESQKIEESILHSPAAEGQRRKSNLSNREEQKDTKKEEKWAEPSGQKARFQEIEEDEEYNAEMERLAAQNMSEEKLWQVTGTRNLASVTETSLIVHSENEFFANLGELLPRLVSLSLDDSELKSLRDLGTSLRTLRSLSLARCDLEELDGLAAFPELRELGLANNRITELDPIFHHETLQVLDVRNNRIHSLMALEVLGTCGKLYRLEFEHNPLISALLACFKITDDAYRRVVSHYVPTLRVLDGSHLSQADRLSLDETQLSILADEVANWQGNKSSQRIENIQEIKEEKAPWQQVLGSRRTQRRQNNNGRHFYNSSMVNKGHQILLEQDPTASALTLDYEPLSGSALSVIRRRPKVSAEPDSVLSTLDQAKELDVQLRRSSESGVDAISPSRLAEWQAETSREYFGPTDESPKKSCQQPKKQLISMAMSDNSRPSHSLSGRPKSAPNEAIVLSPATLAQKNVHEPIRPSTSTALRHATNKEENHHDTPLTLPVPLMLPEEKSQRAPRPVSRRQQATSHSHRRRQKQLQDDDEDKLPPSSFRRQNFKDEEDDDDSEDDTAIVMRSAIKARSAQRSAKNDRPQSGRRPKQRQHSIKSDEEHGVSSTKGASTRLGFDLAGSLAALSQWSEAAADRDDGAVPFQPSVVLGGDSNHLETKKSVTPPQQKNRTSSALPLGAAVTADDDTLIVMLRQPPKAVRHLRTRDGFRRFFSGISERRMRHLLTAAFFLDAAEPDDDAKRRFDKRMALLSDVVV